LASVFNSTSTIFTLDIYKKLNPQASEQQCVRVGKIATTAIVILGIIWTPILKAIGGGVMYQYLQNVQSYIAPPVTAVFLMGILWKRVNAPAAITTLCAGLVMLVLRLSTEIYYQSEIAAHTHVDGIAFAFASINFAHMAIVLFIFSVVLCTAVTLATNPPDYQRIRGLAFGTLTAEDKKVNEKPTALDIVFSLILIAIVIGILSYFTG